jgi:hypothetical protein
MTAIKNEINKSAWRDSVACLISNVKQLPLHLGTSIYPNGDPNVNQNGPKWTIIMTYQENHIKKIRSQWVNFFFTENSFGLL